MLLFARRSCDDAAVFLCFRDTRSSSRAKRLSCVLTLVRSQVLDHHELRYYKDVAQREYAGRIDLGTVIDVRPSTDAAAPAHSLELVTDARVFTVAPATKELMQEWLLRINQVVRMSFVLTALRRYLFQHFVLMDSVCCCARVSSLGVCPCGRCSGGASAS